MPSQTSPGSQIRQPAQPPQRNPLDVVGRLNDLINAYLQYFQVYIPLAILAILLFAVMLLAAYQFLKD